MGGGAAAKHEGDRMYAAEHAATHPDQPAVIMAGRGDVVTYREYEQRANRLAHALRRHGLQRGDHIAVLSENDPWMLGIEAAAERTGLYYTLVNSYLSAEEVAYIVDNSRAPRVLQHPGQIGRGPRRGEAVPGAGAGGHG